jgi:eukaryotic-like serine/threonine-protein kinase
MDAPQSLPVREGEVIDDKYRVDRVIGAGGMGVVVQATHLQLEQRVAIKLLLPQMAVTAEVIARFAREAKAAAKVQGEHVARVMDVGELDNGTPFMVMEYLEGADLAHVVESRGALPVQEAVGYVLQATEAIAAAHALGIVHRDLKPANLFLARKPDGSSVLKVLDFGISKALTGAPGSGSDMSLTKTSAVMGSPLYMSPEQMRSARGVDGRADVWALGVILYELITGHVPFEAGSITELCALILTEPPRPIASLQPDVPPGLVAAIERCLSKDPNQRFPNVAEFASCIAPFGAPDALTSTQTITRVLRAAGVNIQASDPQQSQVLAGAPPGGSTAVAWSPTGSERKPGRAAGVWVAAIAGACVIGAAILVLMLRGRTETPPTGLAASMGAVPASVPAPASGVIVVEPSGSGAPSAPQPSALVAASPPVSPSGARPIAVRPEPPKTSKIPAVPATTAAPPPPAVTPKNPLNINLK